MEKMSIKFYLYQILGIGVIWIGMFFFREDFTDAGKIIFYIVTSWLLFLIVLAIKQFFHERFPKHKDDKQK